MESIKTKQSTNQSNIFSFVNKYLLTYRDVIMHQMPMHLKCKFLKKITMFHLILTEKTTFSFINLSTKFNFKCLMVAIIIYPLLITQVSFLSRSLSRFDTRLFLFGVTVSKCFIIKFLTYRFSPVLETKISETGLPLGHPKVTNNSIIHSTNPRPRVY